MWSAWLGFLWPAAEELRVALHWSQNSESVKKLATELSVRWKHHYLSTEHYLYACCQIDGDCGRWLGRRGFTLQSLEEEILR